jgi:succinate dehydrogenase flavin-adding protein (antitoxin of CptAB toxin-antitoxin module)
MKELDVLLERYVRSRLSEASSEERQVLTQLLELPDPLLSDYLFGHAAAPEPRMAGLVAAIRGATPGPDVGAGPADVGGGRASVGAGAASMGAGAASMGEYR